MTVRVNEVKEDKLIIVFFLTNKPRSLTETSRGIPPNSKFLYYTKEKQTIKQLKWEILTSQTHPGTHIHNKLGPTLV